MVFYRVICQEKDENSIYIRYFSIIDVRCRKHHPLAKNMFIPGKIFGTFSIFGQDNNRYECRGGVNMNDSVRILCEEVSNIQRSPFSVSQYTTTTSSFIRSNTSRQSSKHGDSCGGAVGRQGSFLFIQATLRRIHIRSSTSLEYDYLHTCKYFFYILSWLCNQSIVSISRLPDRQK